MFTQRRGYEWPRNRLIGARTTPLYLISLDGLCTAPFLHYVRFSSVKFLDTDIRSIPSIHYKSAVVATNI